MLSLHKLNSIKMQKQVKTKIYRLLPEFQKEEGRAFRRDVKIPEIDTIYEPLLDGGFNERIIAYQRSRPLYVEEWGKDIDEVRKNPPNKIVWSSGVDIYINPNTHGAKMAYLDKCNYNKSNKNRDTTVKPFFEEINPSATSEENLLNEEQVTIAKYAALKGNIDKLREINLLLGYPKKNPFGELYSESEVRDTARVYIEASIQNADSFNEAWDDSSIDTRINVNRGLSLNIIYIDQNTAEIKWQDNGKPIQTGKIPVGVDALDHLVKFVTLGGKGKTFYDELIVRIMGDDNADKLSKRFSGTVNDAVENMTPEQLFNEAKEMGIIILKAPYYIINNMGEKEGRIGKGKNVVINALKSDTEINGVKLSTMVKTQIKAARA